MATARQIVWILEDDGEDVPTDFHNPPAHEEDLEPATTSTAFRVQTRQSLYMDTFHDHHPVRITIDSGATGNMIRQSLAKQLGATVKSTAHQADGSSPLKVVGETRLSFTRGYHNFAFEGLVVENLDVDILAGTPFMETNDIAVRPAKRQVLLGDGTTYVYGSPSHPPRSTAARRAMVLRAPTSTTTSGLASFLRSSFPATLHQILSTP